jgi:hypothetical protein
MHHPYLLAIARIWVACVSIFFFGLAIQSAFWRDAWDEYFGPDPWRPVMVAGQFALSLALAATAIGVTRRWIRALVAVPIVAFVVYWLCALVYHAAINQFQWAFALQTGVVFILPIVLSLLLMTTHRVNSDWLSVIRRLRPNKSLDRTRER